MLYITQSTLKNDVTLTGGLDIAECQLIHFYLLLQSSSPSKSRKSTQNQICRTYRRDSVRKCLEHICTGENFQNRTPKVHTLRATVNIRNPIILKTFFKAKYTANRRKEQHTHLEKSFTNPRSERVPE